MAVIKTTDITTSTITFYIDELDTNYSASDRYITWTITTPAATFKDGPWGPLPPYISDTYSLSGYNVVFVDLPPNTTISVVAEISYNNGQITLYGGGTTLSTDAPSRPDFFQWQQPKIKGEPFNLTSLEWVALIVNIDKVRAYKGLNGADYGVIGPGEPFTAQLYNNVVNAIIVIPGYIYQNFPLETVSSGDPVTAKCLNDLVAAINSIS